jgi:hypothetical protein
LERHVHGLVDMLVGETVTMNHLRALLPRPSVLASVGMATMALFLMAPVATASAAEDDPEPSMSDDTNAPLTVLRERITASSDDAAQHLGQLLQDAFDRSSNRIIEARRQMELVVTFGHGIEGFMQLDESAFGVSEGDEPSVREAQDRFQYVEDTTDPLAGL